MRYVVDAETRVTRKPQFIAINIASVAPRTDRAPLMPHAHGTICGARELSSRIPVGIGMPSATPTGMSSAAAIAIRAVRDNGIAHVMIGEAIAITAIPSNATI